MKSFGHMLGFLLSAGSCGMSTGGAVSQLRGARLSVGNLRDLGGTALLSGRTMRSGAVLRSASPSNLTETEVLFLRDEVGVRQIIDLRTPDESAKDVGARLLQDQQVPTAHLSLFDEAMLRSGLKRKALRRPRLFGTLIGLRLVKKLSPSRRLRAAAARAADRRLIRMLDEIDLGEMYYWMATQRGREIKHALEMCAAVARDGPVLIHCTHGKDRTGVLVALLLYVCGASERTLIDDYHASDAWGSSVEGRWLMHASLPPHLAERICLDPWCAAPEAAMRGLLGRLAAEYGSVDNYLSSIGVDGPLRGRLEAALTELPE